MRHTTEVAIGESTPIRLGLIAIAITIMLSISGGVVTWVWWASRTTTQLDSIQRLLIILQSNDDQQRKDLNELQAETRLIKQGGSGPVQALTAQYGDMKSRIDRMETMASPLVTRVTRIEESLKTLEEKLVIHAAEDRALLNRKP